MNTYIGIDLGTSSAKFLLVDESGNILSSHTEQYAVRYPQSERMFSTSRSNVPAASE